MLTSRLEAFEYKYICRINATLQNVNISRIVDCNSTPIVEPDSPNVPSMHPANKIPILIVFMNFIVHSIRNINKSFRTNC